MPEGRKEKLLCHHLTTFRNNASIDFSNGSLWCLFTPKIEQAIYQKWEVLPSLRLDDNRCDIEVIDTGFLKCENIFLWIKVDISYCPLEQLKDLFFFQWEHV